MIRNSEEQYYLAVKKLSALFSKITSKQDGEFCCVYCLHSFWIENKLKKSNNVC